MCAQFQKSSHLYHSTILLVERERKKIIKLIKKGLAKHINKIKYCENNFIDSIILKMDSNLLGKLEKEENIKIFHFLHFPFFLLKEENIFKI